MPAHPPLAVTQNQLTYEPLIADPASLLLAMPVPPRFLIYPSTMSTNPWPNPLPHPPDPSCPTHHGKLQALAPTTLLAFLVAAPEFGLVTAEVAVATVHPPQASCTGPTLAILPAICVRLLGDRENAGCCH